MMPTFELFGHVFRTGDVLLFMNYFVSAPLTMILIRKRYGYSVLKAIYYFVLTVGLGVVALHITSAVSNAILVHTSNGAFAPYESINSYGLLLFLSPLFLLYSLLFRDDFRTLADYAAPAVSTVQVVGKLLCFFEGCCYGPADPHGLYYQNLGYKAFPVQLYDTINNAVILVILLILTYTFSKKHKGYLMPISGMLYAVQKGILEEFRVYHDSWEGNFFNTGRTYWQFFLVVVFAACLIWLIGAILWEKKGFPDFDTVNLKLPDCSKPFKKLGARIKNRNLDHQKAETATDKRNQPSKQKNKKK